MENPILYSLRVDREIMQEWRNWQTRRLQVPVVARSCGFKSHLLHYFLFTGSLDLTEDSRIFLYRKSNDFCHTAVPPHIITQRIFLLPGSVHIGIFRRPETVKMKGI